MFEAFLRGSGIRDDTGSDVSRLCSRARHPRSAAREAPGIHGSGALRQGRPAARRPPTPGWWATDPPARSGRVWCGEASRPAGSPTRALRLPPQRSDRSAIGFARHVGCDTREETRPMASNTAPALMQAPGLAHAPTAAVQAEAPTVPAHMLPHRTPAQLLAIARQGLGEAALPRPDGLRYAPAHLPALRAAAPVLPARARPAAPT